MGAKKLTTSDIIILAGGGVMLIASFLPFYKLGDFSESAWSKVSLFPISWFPMVFGLVMAGHVAVTKLGRSNLPTSVLGLTWDQVHLALGSFAALTMLCFLIRSVDPVERGIGLFLMVLGSIALVVGAVVRTKEAPLAGGAGPVPPSPF
ncbi:MAG: hypothetical protein ACT4PW_07360 [Acidimicrobiia bacterium]